MRFAAPTATEWFHDGPVLKIAVLACRLSAPGRKFDRSLSGRSRIERDESLSAMAGRSPYAIDLTSAERAELEQRVACYTRPFKEVQRAKLDIGRSLGAPGTSTRQEHRGTLRQEHRGAGEAGPVEEPAPTERSREHRAALSSSREFPRLELLTSC